MRGLADRIRNAAIFRRYPISKQFVKFCVIGLAATVVDYGLYILLTRLVAFFEVHYILANVIAFTAGATTSYVFNRSWTFRSRDPGVARQYIKFLVVSLIGLGLNTAILAALVTYAGLMDLIAKIIATGLVLFWNFFANRGLTFVDARPKTTLASSVGEDD